MASANKFTAKNYRAVSWMGMIVLLTFAAGAGVVYGDPLYCAGSDLSILDLGFAGVLACMGQTALVGAATSAALAGVWYGFWSLMFLLATGCARCATPAKKIRYIEYSNIPADSS